MRVSLCGWLMVASALSCADITPFALGSVELSHDSDDFDSEIYSIGGGEYLSDNFIDRIGYRHSEGHYSADGFGVHSNADSLFGNFRMNDSKKVDVGGELTRAHIDNGENRWLGWGQVSAQPTTLSNIELRYEKNWVDSQNALDSGVAYDALTLAGDYQFSDRFNLAAVVGHLSFSDDNERPLYRAKATYLLSEDYGVSTYVRYRKYSNSDPYGGNYFSPEDFHDWLAGFGMRRRLPFVRGTFIGAIDWGRQNADGVAAPAHTWQVRLESWIGQRFTYALSTGFNATAGVSGGTDYEYRYTSISASWRF